MKPFKSQKFRTSSIPAVALFVSTIFLPSSVNAGSFGTATNFAVGSYPLSVAVGDVNQDSKLDIITANNYPDQRVGVLLGNGDGTYQAPVNFAAGILPYFVVVADFNGDGKLDIVAANNDDGKVYLLLGNGAGSFAAATSFAAVSSAGERVQSLAVGDFNKDSKPDLAVATDRRYTAQSKSVVLLLGTGTGSFSAAISIANSNTFSGSIAMGDFNGDNNPDLVTTNIHGMSLGVLLGDGTGNFSTAVNFAAGTAPAAVAVADFNSDSKLDLVVTQGSLNHNTVSVLLGDGAGNFSSPTHFFLTGYTPTSVVVGDFNWDGKLDIATANNSYINAFTFGLSVLLGDGTGAFTADTGLPVGTGEVSGSSSPRSVATGDFNGDGKLDLVTANSLGNNVSVVLNNASEQTITFDALPDKISSDAPFTISATGGGSGNNVTFSMIYGPATISGNTVTLTGVADTVSIMASQAGSAHYLAAANVTQSFVVCMDTDGDGAPNNACAGVLADTDDDADGVLDVDDAFPTDASETVDTDGDGYGDNGDTCPIYNTYQHDWDFDGIGDACDHRSDQTILYDVYGDTKGDNTGSSVALADMNGDGFADIVFGSPLVDVLDINTGKMLKDVGSIKIIFSADGDTNKTFYGTVAKQQFGSAIAVIPDKNSDGIPDLVVGDPLADTLFLGKLQKDAGNVSLYSGADGSFLSQIGYSNVPGDHFGAALAVGDVNGDGTADIIIGAPLADTALLKDVGQVIVIDGVTGEDAVRTGSQAGEHFGAAVAVDITQDRLIVGSPAYDILLPVKKTDAGRVQIFDDINGLSAAVATATGALKGDKFGSAVASFGQDMDGDTFNDWAVGIPGADILDIATGKTMKDAGKVQFFSGSNTTPLLFEIIGEATGDNFGAAINAAGNVNHRTANDFVVGIPKFDVPFIDANDHFSLLKDAGRVEVINSAGLF